MKIIIAYINSIRIILFSDLLLPSAKINLLLFTLPEEKKVTDKPKTIKKRVIATRKAIVFIKKLEKTLIINKLIIELKL